MPCEGYFADCVGGECCRQQTHIEVDRRHALAATARLGAVMDDMTNADHDAVHRFLSRWREELGINYPTRMAKYCVNCASEDLVPTPPELISNRALKCNQCGYLQD
jgi:hypothetical protein